MTSISMYAITMMLFMHSSFDMTSEIMSRALPQWKKYIELSRQLQGSYSSEMRDIDTKKGRMTKWIIKKSKGCNMFIIETYAIDGNQVVHIDTEGSVTNRIYNFRINRKPKATDWKATVIEKNDGKKQTDDNSPLDVLLFCGEKMVFPSLLEKPTFVVTSIRDAKGQDGKYCIVDFNFYEDAYLVKCTVHLDIDNYMVVKKSSSKMFTNNELVYEEEFDHSYDFINGIPVPVNRQWARRMKTADNKWLRGTITDNGKFAILDKQLDESEFRLSAFGLPEPAWATGKTSVLSQIPWFLILAIAGVLCLVTASFILYRRNKAAT